MFVHSTSLPQVLAPRAYSSPAFYELEQNRIFKRAWTFVGLKRNLRREGDYLTSECGGCPVVVWNIGGEIRAFRNVCLHRHAQICSGAGCAATLRCQYHGWEYDSSGKVSKIPDAASFKGVELESRHLERIRLETLGDLVFVTTDPDIVSLRTSLGELAEELDVFYGDHWVTAFDEFTLDVNWKVAVENAVESYHVPMVHPQTFRNYRPSELHDHRLTEHYTLYRDLLSWDADPTGRMFKRVTRFLLPAPTFQRFTHLHVFPNLMFYYGDLYSGFSFHRPIGPEQLHFQGWSFMPNRLRWGVAMRPAQYVFRYLLQRTGNRIMAEDAGILPKIHAGLKASQSSGVLSAREERVYAFQRHVEAMTGTRRDELSSAEPR